jgi:hypothetical protein
MYKKQFLIFLLACLILSVNACLGDSFVSTRNVAQLMQRAVYKIPQCLLKKLDTIDIVVGSFALLIGSFLFVNRTPSGDEAIRKNTEEAVKQFLLSKAAWVARDRNLLQKKIKQVFL